MLRKSLLKAFAVCLMMLLLSAGTTSWASTGNIQLQQKGFRLNEPAYVVPVADGRDTVELIESQAAEIEILDAYIASQDAELEKLDIDITRLKDSMSAERSAWSSRSQELAHENKRLQSPWSIGFFGGYDVLHREIAVGVGMCFSIVRF